MWDEFRDLATEKKILQHSTGLLKSFDPISTKWTWKLQWKINYSQMPSTQFEMIFPVLWLLLLPLEFQRNETEMMTNVEAADKRQAGRREGQESQGGAGKEEGKKICRFFKAHKCNLFAENWSDMGETVTDVAWAGLKRVQGPETCADRHMLCTQPSGAFFWTPRDKNLGKNGVMGGWHETYFPSNKCHRRHSA